MERANHHRNRDDDVIADYCLKIPSSLFLVPHQHGVASRHLVIGQRQLLRHYCTRCAVVPSSSTYLVPVSHASSSCVLENNTYCNIIFSASSFCSIVSRIVIDNPLLTACAFFCRLNLTLIRSTRKKMKNKNNVIVAASFFLVMQAQAFAPSPCSPCSFRDSCGRSSTEISGLRTFLRKKLSKSKYNRSGSETSSPPATTMLELPPLHELEHEDSFADSDGTKGWVHVSVGTSTSNLPNSKPSISASSQVVSDEHFIVEDTANVVTLDRVIEKGNLDEPYTLPPIGDRQLTKLENEFREMLLDFSQYTQSDILAVRNPRMRVIFQGVAASFGLPEVYRAFEVLFEDYAPLRVAGRLIYGKLKSVMVEAQLERQKQVDNVVKMTGLSREDIEVSRSAYFRLVVHEDDSATEMTLQQIVDYGLAEMAVEVLGFENFDEFVQSLNPCEKQKVAFENLMLALQSCSVDSTGPECNSATILQEIAGRLDARGPVGRFDNSDQKKQRINERYDSMVQRFREWKDLVPNGDGRRLEVLRGCFVGADSEEIVEALRVVYIDYSALRMSGDLIFKVMATLVGRKS